MAQTTGISWTDATVNFVIGCTPIGPGCDNCYASTLARRKWAIEFKVGGERHVTKSGFIDPIRWHKQRVAGFEQRITKHGVVKTPTWVFACSLSDFFDNEWPDEVRTRAWRVIRETPSLRWQIVTKRIGNVAKMLPADWADGQNYKHVGIIATVCSQDEYDRDMRKLVDLKIVNGVRWIGLSVEPMLGPLALANSPFYTLLDWVICGGESKQEGFMPRVFDLEWAQRLLGTCLLSGIPFWMKQMGDNPVSDGKPVSFWGKGDDFDFFPKHLQVQQMPRIYSSEASPQIDTNLFGEVP